VSVSCDNKIVSRYRTIYIYNLELPEQDLSLASLAVATAAETRSQICDLLPTWPQEAVAENRSSNTAENIKNV
jgi:hypothetical protein